MNSSTFDPTTDSSDMSELSTLTLAQEKTLAMMGVVSGSLSVLGSSTIVYKVLKKKYIRTPYDRLMLGLSTCDIIASVTLALGPFLIPASTSQRVWAIGNDATCNMLGWFFQFSFSAIMYNGLLSYYYLLTVRFGVKREEFARKYEKWMHGLTLLWFVATATYGSAIGLWHELELGFGCYANDFPENCEQIDPNTCTSHYYGWIMAALPSLFVLLSLIVNNIIIVLYVRRKLDPNRVYETERAERQATQIREVATQGYLYVGTFMISYWATLVVRAMESIGYTYEHEADLYIILLMNAFFQPLQGFFNMLVYNKPNYLRVRIAYPDISRFEAIRIACFHPDIPRLTTNGNDDNSKSNTGASKKARLGRIAGKTPSPSPHRQSPPQVESSEEVSDRFLRFFTSSKSRATKAATSPFISRKPTSTAVPGEMTLPMATEELNCSVDMFQSAASAPGEEARGREPQPSTCEEDGKEECQLDQKSTNKAPSNSQIVAPESSTENQSCTSMFADEYGDSQSTQRMDLSFTLSPVEQPLPVTIQIVRALLDSQYVRSPGKWQN